MSWRYVEFSLLSIEHQKAISDESITIFLLPKAWGRTSGGTAAGIRFLSDHKAEFTRALGLAMEDPMLTRCKRFSLVAEDGVVTHYFSSDESSSNTWAPAMLAAL